MRFLLRAINSWDDCSNDSNDPCLSISEMIEAPNKTEAVEKAKKRFHEWVHEAYNHAPDEFTHYCSAELIPIKPVWEIEYDKGKPAKAAVPARLAKPAKEAIPPGFKEKVR